MWIESITLNHYRNYQNISANFSKNLNVFIGRNAQGKTNFLEAIYFLSLTRSHRTRSDKELIAFNQDKLHLSGIVHKQNGKVPLEIHLSDKGRITKVNHLKQNRLSDYIGNLTVVLFAPEDLQLIKGSPSLRRKFLDIDLGQIKTIYLSDLSQYNHVLKQRNAYLKNTEKVDTTFLSVLDEQLADFGSRVMVHRHKFIKDLEIEANRHHATISEETEKLKVTYDSSIKFTDLSTLRQDYLQQLTSQHRRDIFKKNTGIGPHRDDISFFINEMNANFGSQGQHRSLILSLKMAEIELIKQSTGEYPILLLDDVMSELDNHRQAKLLEAVLKENVQTFITTTSLEHLKQIPENITIFTIDKGTIKSGV
ncbi:DNA replication/repair protein RecF [Streptococcus thoraltensis]|uniref:DNA replication/repair protein RecF n=1 Tax=Streptococcus thoraltensis TaxID=55085 RepID=UPI000376F523|nr:DNA replication/repair protein RecF [Streptococcus thoraltensis]MDY4760749.1 DNA replication/repair protein RecF [Streptococcus thoraltensis]